ncbi:putative multidrug resistance protein [Leptospira kobayashii]|uniref:Guanidinium exporter n=1 Tax=Leptospira kobayashii TaxID=1917830 RepID=A0ABM7UKZ1_9LEPT|nr:SMR family transporter [Leptospira kobayashii]BDA79531.1 putative multidrug resistance protein [Leptospira kobayashii]
MNWIVLILAGVFEIGWPLGIKLSESSEYKIPWIGFSIFSMIISVFLLWYAQKTIPMGTAYAVWTGIGATGAFLLGIIVFGESSSLWRVLSVSLIVIGVMGLKLTGEH